MPGGTAPKTPGRRPAPVRPGGTQGCRTRCLRDRREDPRSLSLADVHSRGAKCKQSFDLRVAVARAEVKVQPILDRHWFRHRNEQQPGEAIRRGSYLELAGLDVDDNDGAECSRWRARRPSGPRESPYAKPKRADQLDHYGPRHHARCAQTRSMDPVALSRRRHGFESRWGAHHRANRQGPSLSR
jgi:hypothetical protein